MTIIDKQLAVNFELNHSQATPETRSPQDSLQDGDIGARIHLRGNQGSLKYWGKYQYYGENFANRLQSTPHDEWGRELGAELTFGIFKPRVELRQVQDNVSQDWSKAQTTASKGEFSLRLSLPDAPTLTLAYGRELRAQAERPGGWLERHIDTDSFTGTLWYGRPMWDTYLTSSYLVARDRLQADELSKTNFYMVAATYRPFEGLALRPSLELTQTSQVPTDYKTETVAANLGVDYYTADGSLGGFAYGSFVTDQDSDGYVNNQSVNLAWGLEKDLKSLLALRHSKQSLLLRFNHYRYTDFLYSGSNRATYSALLMIKISP